MYLRRACLCAFVCVRVCVFFSSRQAHAKRVAAENKRTRRFALGGGFGGGRSRAARPKMGNSRGMVVKAFVADSDDEEESDEVSCGSWGSLIGGSGGGFGM